MQYHCTSSKTVFRLINSYFRLIRYSNACFFSVRPRLSPFRIFLKRCLSLKSNGLRGMLYAMYCWILSVSFSPIVSIGVISFSTLAIDRKSMFLCFSNSALVWSIIPIFLYTPSLIEVREIFFT